MSGILLSKVVFLNIWGRYSFFLIEGVIFMRKILLLSAVLFGSIPSAYALDPMGVFEQNAPKNCVDKGLLDKEIGLPELLEIGLCNNPKLNRGYMAVKAEEASLGSSKAEYLPSLSLEGQVSDAYDKVETVNSNADNPYRANAALSWMLYDFGGRSARVKRAENYLLSVRFEYNALVKDTFLEINKAYFDLLSAQEVLKSAKTSEASFKKSFEESARRYELGLVSLSDKLLAKTSYEESRLEVVQAENQVKGSQGKLATLLNVSPTTVFKLLKPKNDRDLTKLAMKDMTVEKMIDTALSLRPEIEKADADIEASVQNIKALKAGHMPTISLMAQSGYHDNWRDNKNAEYSSSVALNLSVPLFSGFKVTYNVKEAEAQKEQALFTKKEMIDTVKNEVWTSYHNYQTAVSSYDISKKALESAVENERVAFASYQVGKGDILNLLTAGSQLANARKEVIVAYYAVLTSKASLYRAIGRF